MLPRLPIINEIKFCEKVVAFAPRASKRTFRTTISHDEDFHIMPLIVRENSFHFPWGKLFPLFLASLSPPFLRCEKIIRLRCFLINCPREQRPLRETRREKGGFISAFSRKRTFFPSTPHRWILILRHGAFAFMRENDVAYSPTFIYLKKMFSREQAGESNFSLRRSHLYRIRASLVRLRVSKLITFGGKLFLHTKL